MVPVWYYNGVRTTIDKAGRMVIPAAIRDRAGLLPGTELEVELDETGIRLTRVVPRPELVRLGRRLVARPTAPLESLPVVEVAAWIEEERDRWP
ncbi:MAG: AbrB/MazE/SpoVT family DNA-binding domain-containing protein [Thermoanaerobaculia bacterium]